MNVQWLRGSGYLSILAKVTYMKWDKHWKLNQLYYLDDEVPLMTCVKNQSRNIDEGQETATVVWENPIAADNSGFISNVVCTPRSGSHFTIGETIVTCEAIDKSGNRANCSFQVIVTAIVFIPFFHVSSGVATEGVNMAEFCLKSEKELKKKTGKNHEKS